MGTAIVTAEADEGPRGFLALSATHLSADPPPPTASVDNKTSALATILAAQHFAINYLSTAQEEIAGPFGGKGDLKGADRFSTATWTTLATGAPVLAGAAGALDCALEQVIEHGNTSIVIGRLVDFTGTDGALPLVQWKGKPLGVATK